MPDRDDPLRALEARALALLARREYTRAELARRLAQPRSAFAGARRDPAADAGPGAAGEMPPAAAEHIDQVIDALAQRGLLSDQRAAEAIVHARAHQRGLLRVRLEMEQRGVPEEVAAAALAGLHEQQVPLAREVWRKRFDRRPADAAERGRQTRFLAARGFSFEVIRAVLGDDQDS